MRILTTLLALLCFAAPIRADEPTRFPSVSYASGNYRLARTDGNIYLVTRFAKEGNAYVITDVLGKRTSHLVDSVSSIEPVGAEEFAKLSAEYASPGSGRGGSSVRTSARTTARTTPPVTANPTSLDVEPTYSLSSSSYSNSTQNFSSPSFSSSSRRSGGYYTGPRQPSGTYIGGSGSSHKGGHYSNSHTGNHYQKHK